MSKVKIQKPKKDKYSPAMKHDILVKVAFSLRSELLGTLEAMLQPPMADVLSDDMKGKIQARIDVLKRMFGEA